jgi:hypothetical protein
LKLSRLAWPVLQQKGVWVALALVLVVPLQVVRLGKGKGRSFV